MEKKERKQIYMNRFCSCSLVFNVMRGNEPIGSRCIYGSQGGVNQRPEIKRAEDEKCSNCIHYKYRKSSLLCISEEKVQTYIDKTIQDEVVEYKRGIKVKSKNYLYNEVVPDSLKKSKHNLSEPPLSKNKKGNKKYIDFI